jgi:hypothetical protein
MCTEGEKQAAAWLKDEYYDLDKDEPTPYLLIQDVYEKRRLGKDYQKALDDLIYSTIGRIS